MNKTNFILTADTIIDTESIIITKPIQSGIKRMKRDMETVLESAQNDTCLQKSSKWKIKLESADMEEEGYSILFKQREEIIVSAQVISAENQNADPILKSVPLTNWNMIIQASSDLGFLYAFLHISEYYLGITPLWFFNDQKLEKKKSVFIPIEEIHSPAYKVRFRGWFINDEVLLNTWKIGGDNTIVWEMVFEALLRLGGNTVIPGTDRNSRIHRQQASDMGLWISHHHAEPLGAEMFARVYPDLLASYDSHPDKFLGLWKQGIKEQKDMKVIWNLGFRGQGDCPFWSSDEKYITPKARGELISEIIERQAALVREQTDNPVFCTNLYGEIMELYQQGYIRLPADTIRVRADNGYGRMVSRRQDLYNPRISALPGKEEQEQNRLQGIYYHVSFYDLQAANHITMLPNSLDLIREEITTAFSCRVDDFLIVNCSNIKPHVYYLEAIAALWREGEINTSDYTKKYVNRYYSSCIGTVNQEDREKLLGDMASCFSRYADSAIQYGEWEDDHAGEQFYNYMTRGLYTSWMQGKTRECTKSLSWATGDISFPEQIEWYLAKCKEGLVKFEELHRECARITALLNDPELWKDSLALQASLHLLCIKGAVEFCKAFQSFQEEKFQEAFYLMGTASRYYKEADALLRNREHDKWEGYYANDCLSDIKFTAYLLKQLMAYIRNIGEGPRFYDWQRELYYSETDRKVMLITNFENHKTDEELFEYISFIAKGNIISERKG